MSNTIADAFDANGNVLQLQAGQALNWNLRNPLQEVRPVVRESGLDDSERYVYDASGQRLRKVRTTQAKAVTHIAEVRYLPGLEIRTNTAAGETLQVITAQAGRNGVRVLHGQAGKQAEVSNDQYRYGLNDHLASSTLERDATGLYCHGFKASGKTDSQASEKRGTSDSGRQQLGRIGMNQ